MSVRRFTKGPKILVDFGNRILDEVEGVTVMPGVGIRHVKTSKGIVLLPVDTSGSNGTPAALQPSSDVSNHSDPKYTITYGTYGGVVPTISGTPLSAVTSANVITFGPTDTYCYAQCDYTYDTSTGAKTIVDAEIMTGSGSLPASTISGGSGTQYQIIYGVTITAPVGAGPYTVVAAPGVSTSQDFNICLAGPSVSGPFRQ